MRVPDNIILFKIILNDIKLVLFYNCNAAILLIVVLFGRTFGFRQD